MDKINMNIHSIISQLVVALSIATATGVFIHDGRIDKAMDYKPAPLEVTAQKIANHPHTHSEHNTKALKSVSRHTPARPPKEQLMKRYLLQNIEPRGRHAFDNSFLPIVG